MTRGRFTAIAHCVWLLIAVGIAAGFAHAAPPKALAFIHGVWQGEGRVIILDTERMQANASSEKPFERAPLIIRNMTERMVTFSIGEQRFIGLFDGDALALTGDGMTGTVRLLRMPGPARKN
ncbi:conserved exported hypothetical protein [Hyphomicrobiales bacterium]|nr:conserved exported hypothetical protein [Hyphomicrobiales bacterium]CAH1697488.1 conserved exported hypothetical protein [Hyphomicrobiales bacterium]CAI0345676.1 conserved exported hypothetical protein [Hyphomicrobiales bacterium]